MNLCAVYREAVNITPRILNLVQLYEVYEVLRDDSVPRCRSSRGDLQKKRLHVNTKQELIKNVYNTFLLVISTAK